MPHYNLFTPSLLANAEILELGGGTGVLSTLLAPLVGSWTVTDIPELLPLIQKNHNRNHQRLASSNVDVLELDWTWTEQQFQKNAKQVANHQYHLVFAVDCLYNESLVQPFVNTLNRINTKFVVVVSELRSADVLRMFLEIWLESGNWTVYRPTESTAPSGTLSDKATQTSILGRRHVIWIGWKS